jgi:hypothetical protein
MSPTIKPYIKKNLKGLENCVITYFPQNPPNIFDTILL